MARLFQYDPIADSIGPGRALASPPANSSSRIWLTDGRLALSEVPEFLGGSSNMRLRYIPLGGGPEEVEDLPLPFTSFHATHDLRRAVGVVQNWQADVWLVPNFDPRR